MAIKKIQLRGISRSPSDHMTEDGGVAESLNVQLDSTEIAPIVYAEDVTSKVLISDNLQADRIFIHKTPEYENYIVQQGNRIFTESKEGEQTILTLEESEEVNDIDSIGNIVIISTSNRVTYSLWKTNKYKYIGDSLPIPSIRFDVLGNDEEHFYGKSGGMVKVDAKGGEAGLQSIAEFKKTAWEEAIRELSDIEEVNSFMKTLQQDFWTAVKETKTKIGKWGHFCCPRLVRYAVKLYDGSYVCHSVPILLGAGSAEWISVTGSHVDTISASSIGYDIQLFYKAKAKLVSWDVEDWTDIISGVDIFISDDIAFPRIGEEFSTCDDGGGKIYFKGYEEAFETTKAEILSKSNFYKIVSVSAGDLSSLREGIDLHHDPDVESLEMLALKERLTSDYMTSHRVIPKSGMTFNSRLLINANKIVLPAPYTQLNAVFCDVKYSGEVPVNNHTEKRYQFKFHIRRNNGEEYSVFARGVDGSTYLKTPLISNGAPSAIEKTFYAIPMAWIAYPDPNCYKVEVDLGGGDIAELEMYAHPQLSCAYAFIGLDEYFDTLGAAADAEIPEDEKNTYSVNNQVMLSEVNNPFIFPAANRYTMQSKILGIALTTTALSQGQFGQFPLYVFTEDGIWAMETKPDGSFGSSKPLSRDVCVNPKSITSIDNAVVFVTDQGVMMLKGSQVMNISPYMNGRHYQIENSARVIIENQDFFCDLLPALSDNTHFLAFVKEASVAYDYAGKRLIFIKHREKYQYVYKLDTQTWHKVTYGDLIAPLNSYPECLAQGISENLTAIFNLSTLLDKQASEIPMRGVIATRPFDLGEPDVFKTITDVRIRGQFPKGAVKFILLGSNDGINFATVSTLRGRAWKLFRMVILADLAPTERISWVDIMYETKFTNKLR